MISIIEKEYMETVIRMGKRLQRHEIDWEQRRYEIAKDCLSSLMPEVTRGVHDMVVGVRKGIMDQSTYDECVKEMTDGAIDIALGMADALAARLQEPKKKSEPKTEPKSEPEKK